MSDPSIARRLSTGRLDAGLSLPDLWFTYCGLGGRFTPLVLDRYLAGTAVPTRHEYDILAQAINEAFVDRALSPSMPYAEDLASYDL